MYFSYFYRLQSDKSIDICSNWPLYTFEYCFCYFLRQEDAALDSADSVKHSLKLTTSAIEKDILVTRYFFVSIIKSKGRCFCFWDYSALLPYGTMWM